MLVEIDWSAGHSKHRDGALNAKAMSVKYGGAQPKMRATTIERAEGFLGPDSVLKVGDVQSMIFEESDGPPHFEPDAPPHDTETKEGYVGRPKGLKQVLWERGLHVDGMIGTIEKDDKKGRDQSLSMTHVSSEHDCARLTHGVVQVLANCWDFATELTAFQELMISHGHLAEMSPKCHPELAGVGVEYSWGKSKMYFRRHTDHIAKHLHANIEESMAPNILTLLRVRRYARKARSYRRAYETSITAMSKVNIEKIVKMHKCHRAADDFDFAFINHS